MDVTIQDAINAFSLLSEHVNENGFLHECYNLGISALKTIQDGNYKLNNEIPVDLITKIAEYDCREINFDCDSCKYYSKSGRCISAICANMLQVEEVKKWIQENS